MTPALFLALALTRPPADTVRLMTLGSFVRSRRPEVLLVTDRDDTTRVRVIMTARDPQNFTSDTLHLFPDRETGGVPMAMVRSDSSAVDSRMSVSRHTLWFWVDRAALRGWAESRRPTFRLGEITIRLDPRQTARLRTAVSGPGAMPPR
jgi:hypothetical protein